MLRGARRGIWIAVGIALGGHSTIALQPYLDRPMLVGLTCCIFACGAFVVRCQRHEVVFIASGSVEHLLQFLCAGGILGRRRRGVTARRVIGYIVYCLPRMGSRIRLDGVCRIELIGTDIHLTILYTLCIHHIVCRKFDSYYVLIESLILYSCF